MKLHSTTDGRSEVFDNSVAYLRCNRIDLNQFNMPARSKAAVAIAAAAATSAARMAGAPKTTAGLFKLSHQASDLETNTHIDVRFYQVWGNV